MAGGRPSKYCPEILEITRDYIDNFSEEKYGDRMPMIASLATHLGVCKDTVFEWQKDEEKAEFSDLVRELMQKQEATLFNQALGGKFNASISKLALTKHGYRDQQGLSDGDGGKLIPDGFIIEHVRSPHKDTE